MGGPSAKVGSSAKFCVLICKASLLSYLGGYIGQSRFVCQVLGTGIQGISALLLGGPSARQSAYISSNGKHLKLPFRSTGRSWGVHLPKYVCLPSFVYQYSRHLCCITLGGSSAQVICQNQLSQQYYILHLANMSPHSWNCHVWGVLGCFRGCCGGYIWQDCTMLTDCLLP